MQLGVSLLQMCLLGFALATACSSFLLGMASCVGGEKEMVKGLVQWDIVLMHKLSPCLHHPQSRAFALVNTQ